MSEIHDVRLSRRRLLQLAAAGPIVKPLPPEWFIPIGTNAEMRWDAAADLGYLIPNERFFVRNHTATLIIDPATWRLNVFGSGLRNPEGITLSLRDLRRLPSHTTTGYPPDEPPLTRQAVKSAFELPFGAALPAGRRHVLTGRSWSGAAPIRRVDVSTDGGRTFAPADLHGPNQPNAWVRCVLASSPASPAATS